MQLTQRPSAAPAAAQLPNEVWTHILGYVPIGEHAAVRLVCTHLCALSQSSALWQPIINAALRRPLAPSTHPYGHVSGSIRQATRALEAMPPSSHQRAHLAAPAARQTALNYIREGLRASDVRFSAMHTRFAHSALPHLTQDDLRSLWLRTCRTILHASPAGSHNDWVTNPSVFFARAIYLQADSQQAALWLDVVAQGALDIPPSRLRQAHHLLTTAFEHVMGIAPPHAMPALLNAAVALYIQASTHADFDVCYIDACVARMSPADKDDAHRLLERLIQAPDPPHVHAAAELATALWIDATPAGAPHLARLLWQCLAHPNCDVQRLQQRVIAALVHHTPVAQLEAVWGLVLRISDFERRPGAASTDVVDALAQRYTSPCDASVLGMVLGQATRLDGVALLALEALGRHAVSDVQRNHCFELLYPAACAPLSPVPRPAATGQAAAAPLLHLPRLISALVSLSQHPIPSCACATRLFQTLWQHVLADGLHAEICLPAMDMLAEVTAPAAVYAVFHSAFDVLSHISPATPAPYTIALLRSLACTLPYIDDMKHAHTLVLLQGMLGRCDVHVGAAAAQVLVGVRHGDGERHTSVQCIVARAQRTLHSYTLTLAELSALDSLKRCELALRPTAPPSPPLPRSLRRHASASPVPNTASVWRYEQQSCHELLSLLTSPVCDDDA